MSERVFKPLSLVSDASKKIAAGDYGNKINIRGNDEIAEMAESFNNMAEEIQKYIARMAEASEKKQRFADNFSHEIRTPLTSIYGSAEYLQRTAVDDEEKYKLTDRILSECKHMLATAERMLTLSSLRSAEITMETIDVDELFEDAKESLRLKLVQNKIELHCEHDIASLQGDKTLLKSLLINLSNNAADACENGGHIVWCVSTSANGNVMTVTDDGKGIAADKVDRIIEPFYRIDKAKRRTEGGVGLGLAICAQICACHNAVLSFSSELGSGTTATITFTN